MFSIPARPPWKAIVGRESITTAFHLSFTTPYTIPDREIIFSSFFENIRPIQCWRTECDEPLEKHPIEPKLCCFLWVKEIIRIAEWDTKRAPHCGRVLKVQEFHPLIAYAVKFN